MDNERIMTHSCRAESWVLVAIVGLIILAAVLIAAGCSPLIALRTGEMRAIQSRSVEWCRKDPRACPAARTCAAAAVKASEAWVGAAVMRRADAESLRGGAPINLAQLQQQEAEANSLDTFARLTCDPANARGIDGKLLMQDARVLVDGTVEVLAEPVDSGVHRDLKPENMIRDAGADHGG